MADIEKDTVDLLRDLVAIDSQNPSLAPGGAGEGAIAAHLERWATAAGLETRRLEATPGRPSLLITTPGGAGGGPTLLLCAHTDTVGVGGMARPFEPVVEGDRLYGRGAYDMKSGLAAALIAAREAARSSLRGRVVVAAVADEEEASLGVQEVLRHLVPDAAIVTEPTELAVATSHRGFAWIEIEVVGVAAHGSRPHLGRDAIMKTGPILVALAELNDRLAARVHPRLGRGFVHAGTIAGGREPSTVPERCTLTIERRTLPGEGVADVENQIEELLERCRAADPEVVVSARTTLARPPFEISDEDPFVRTVAGAVGTTLGRDAELSGVSYWADSAFLAEKSIPTVLFGPAGDGAHAAVEWASLQSTADCARALLAVAQAFCR